jgi:hypothetical protein
VLTRTFPAKSATAQTKAFCFFFSKKKTLPSTNQPPGRLILLAASTFLRLLGFGGHGGYGAELDQRQSGAAP